MGQETLHSTVLRKRLDKNGLGQILTQRDAGIADLANQARVAADQPDSLLLAEVERHPSGLTVWPNHKGPMQALLRGPYHYIRESDGREQLFDWWADPAEEHELGTTEAGKPLLESLRAALAALHM